SDPVETFPVLSIATAPPLLLLAALILLRALQTQHRAQRPGAIDPFLRWHLLLRTDIRSPGRAQDPREKYHLWLDLPTDDQSRRPCQPVRGASATSMQFLRRPRARCPTLTTRPGRLSGAYPHPHNPSSTSPLRG